MYKYVCGTVSRATIYSWIKSINTSSTIDLKSPTDRPRIIRTENLIQKVKQRFSRKKRVSSLILAKEMNVSRTAMRRLIREDLGLKPYGKRTASNLKE